MIIAAVLNTPSGRVRSSVNVTSEPHQNDVVVFWNDGREDEYVVSRRRWENGQLLLVLDPVLIR